MARNGFMKKQFLMLALFMMPLAFRSQNVTASLEGIVVDRVTSEGIVGASLLLTGIVEDRVVNLTVKTGPGGRFTFANVPPSSGYWLMASHGEAHVQTVYGQRGFFGTGTLLPVASGQQIKDLQIAMVPTGAISGRVLDARGKPVSDAQVLVMKSTYLEGTRVFSPVKGLVRTNRRGEYRVSGLTPGPYYLRVHVQTPGGSAPFLLDRVRDSDWGALTESEGYPYIYYPNATNDLLAKAVTVPARGSVDGVDVTVFTVRTRRIRGTVLNEATGVMQGPAEVMLFLHGDDRGSLPVRSVTSPTGSFDLRSIPPGSYLLVATLSQGSATLRGRLVLNVGTDDLNDLKIPVTPGFSLSGRVSLPAASPPDIFVTLRPDAPSSTGLLPPAAFDQPLILFPRYQVGVVSAPRRARILEIPARYGVLRDNAVTFRDIAPWDYSLEVNGPKDTYLKSARVGSKDVLTDGLRIDGPIQASLEIEIGSPAGQIEGRVLDSAQRPLSALRVVLVPEKERRRRLDLYRSFLTDALGRFRFESLTPGDYKVFAWEFAEKDLWLDANFLRLYEDAGTPIHIEEGSREVLEVHAIPPWF